MNQHRLLTKKILNRSILLVAAVALSLFLFDWTLDLLNFPSEVPQRVSHPANFEKVVQNIEFEYLFETNDRGLRYRNIAPEKAANSYRVFVAGDSYTEGIGVDEGKRFTDLLEGQFNPSSVLFINGGLVGTGPLEYGRLFLNVGLEYNPDALLICLFANDVVNTPEELAKDRFGASTSRPVIKKIAHYLWPRVYTLLKTFRIQRVSQSMTKTSDFISMISKTARKRNISQPQINRWKKSLPQELVKAVNQGKLNGFILTCGLFSPRYWIDSIDISSGSAKKKWENMTNILSEMLVQSKQRRIETAIVLIPSPFQYDPKTHDEKNPWIIAGTEIRKEWLSEDTELQKRMRLWARLENVPFLDLTPVFRGAIESNKNLNWELDGHLNHFGHQVAAKAIASWLLDQQVFSFIKNKGNKGDV